MHETGIALEIFRSAIETASNEAGEVVRLVKVWVSIGDRSAVDPTLLESAWQSIVIGTRHDGAELQVRWCASRRYCPSCNQVKKEILGSWMPICPDCGDVVQMEGGQQLDLDSVEFNKFASPHSPSRSKPSTQTENHV